MIRVVCVGKLREKYLVEGVNEFLKRIRKYSEIEMIEVKKEEQILKHAKGFIAVLDVKGREMSSEELASLLTNRQITFVVGGPEGLTKDVLEKANFRLSFSKMTFPHQMIRLMLAEQIYRAFTIIKKENYHK
ncbi:23S rRNA (pseudouridine(1915)-N(3))-methyltransferase RlmH [Candidatus Woesearchaeota archaeon]|nr:23S rRNA (pseudouridine(1915)-N(3))-methyltransferase RlmH [Candidatus Woesearchaeota archaeon]